MCESEDSLVIYAADRWESSKQIKNWMDKGLHTLFIDRYVPLLKFIEGHNKCEKNVKLLLNGWMKWSQFKIPRAHITIYLSYPWNKSKVDKETRKLYVHMLEIEKDICGFSEI